MTEIRIPSNSRCQVGTVAFVVDSRVTNIGKLVVVTAPFKFVEYLQFSNEPLFCWWVNALHGQIDCDGGPRWDGYLPDVCLLPVASMSEGQVRAVVRKHAESDFAGALDNLAKVFKKLDDEIDRKQKLGGNPRGQMELGILTQIVQTESVFEDVGFTLDRPEGECMSWTISHQGIPLQFGVGPGMFRGWHATASKTGIREVMFMELDFPSEMVRGEVLLKLAKAWREAFPGIALPETLKDAAVYEEFKHARCKLNPGLPNMVVDARCFRFAINQMRAFTDGEMLVGVTITMVPGQLEIRIADRVLHCPARGSWFGEASMDLTEFLAAIRKRYARGAITIALAEHDRLLIDGAPVRATWTDANR